MPVLEVLLDSAGHVVGTATVTTTPIAGGPVNARMTARPGQRLVTVTVDDKVAALDAKRLHEALVDQHLS